MVDFGKVLSTSIMETRDILSLYLANSATEAIIMGSIKTGVIEVYLKFSKRESCRLCCNRVAGRSALRMSRTMRKGACDSLTLPPPFSPVRAVIELYSPEDRGIIGAQSVEQVRLAFAS